MKTHREEIMSYGAIYHTMEKALDRNNALSEEIKQLENIVDKFHAWHIKHREELMPLKLPKMTLDKRV